MIQEKYATHESNPNCVLWEVMKKRFKKRWVFLVLLLLIGSPIALGRVGFCFKENKWLSKREYVDRFLFGDNASLMSFDEKVQVMKDRDGSEYPNNCSRSLISHLFYGGLFSLTPYQIDCVHPRNSDHYHSSESENKYYYYSMYAVDSCGKSHDFYGDTIKEKLYKIQLKRNKEYWEDK